MQKTLTVELEPPRFEDAGPLLIAGLRERYTIETMKRIPAQWQRFTPQMGNIPVRVGRAAYGVRFNTANGSGSFDYLSGVEVSGFSGLPDELSVVSIPAQKFAVFTHRGPVWSLRSTIYAVLNEWLSESGHEIAHQSADTPKFIERYGKDFDLQSEMGDIEVWVPIKE